MAFPNLRYFRESEFAYPDRMDSRLLLLLDDVRERAGVPIRITSDYRTKEEHEAIYPNPASRPNSPHRRGTAVDLQPMPSTARNRLKVLAAIMELYDSGAWPQLGLEIADRHFHVDNDHVLRRPHLWIGRSR